MTTTTQISTRQVDGSPCVITTEAAIADALAGAPITVNTGPLAGDTVYLTSRECGFPFERRTVVREMDHPKFGRVLTAWIDTNRTDGAPTLRRMLGEQLRAAGVVRNDVPSCDNCGDCSRCC
jgi:hypothetical protein